MGLLDKLLAKLGYTARNVTAIGNAANERGAEIDLYNDPLAAWPDKIRRIPSAPGIAPGDSAGLKVTVKVVQPRTLYIDHDYRPPRFDNVEARVPVSGTGRFN